MVLISRTAPKHSFGSASRDLGAVGTTPGPGDYGFHSWPRDQPRRKPRGGAAVIGTSNRFGVGPMPSPGPGSYSARKLGRGPAITCSFRHPMDDEIAREAVPGPGTYHNSCTRFSEGPRYSMPGKGPEADLSQVPGPGQYGGAIGRASSARTRGSRSLQYGRSFGRAPRSPGMPDAMPGPGQYRLGDTFGAGPRFSLASRQPAPLCDTTGPGPGAHDVLQHFGR